MIRISKLKSIAIDLSALLLTIGGSLTLFALTVFLSAAMQSLILRKTTITGNGIKDFAVCWLCGTILPIWGLVFLVIFPKKIRGLFKEIPNPDSHSTSLKINLQSRWIIFRYNKTSKYLQDLSLSDNPELKRKVTHFFKSWDRIIALFILPIYGFVMPEAFIAYLAFLAVLAIKIKIYIIGLSL